MQKFRAILETEYGSFTAFAYEDFDHIVLIKGDVKNKENVLVRLHSECLTGDVFQSKRCDCSHQLSQSLHMIEKKGFGVVIYLRQEGRGIGLPRKIHAYHLQDQGLDTVEANLALGFPSDLREYKIAATILEDLEIKSIHLLTNNPEKIEALNKYGIKIAERVPLPCRITKENKRYLETKKIKLGHLLEIKSN